MNLKDATYVASNPDQGQLKSQLGTSSSTGPQQELEAMNIEADMSPGKRSRSGSFFPEGPGSQRGFRPLAIQVLG